MSSRLPPYMASPVFLTLLACGTQATPVATTDSAIETGDMRVLATPTFGKVRGLELTDDGTLVIFDSRIAPYITLFDPRGDSLVSRFGDAGEGPGELTSPDRIDLVPGTPQSLWILQANRWAMTRFSLGPEPAMAEEVRFRTQFALDAATMTDAGILALGIFTDPGAVFLGDSQFGKPRGIGAAPYRPEDLPAVAVFDANRAAFDRMGDRIALAYRYSPEIHVMTVTGEQLAKLRSPIEVGNARKSFPESKVPNFSPDSSDIAFTQVALSERGVFAVFCGCRGSTLADHDSLEVHFYKLDTGYAGKFMAPAPITAIAATRGGDTLYLATEQMDPVVMQVPLLWSGK